MFISRVTDILQIKPNIHSTDTHGTNEVNVAILDLFGYRLAPEPIYEG